MAATGVDLETKTRGDGWSAWVGPFRSELQCVEEVFVGCQQCKAVILWLLGRFLLLSFVVLHFIYAGNMWSGWNLPENIQVRAQTSSVCFATRCSGFPPSPPHLLPLARSSSRRLVWFWSALVWTANRTKQTSYVPADGAPLAAARTIDTCVEPPCRAASLWRFKQNFPHFIRILSITVPPSAPCSTNAAECCRC